MVPVCQSSEYYQETAAIMSLRYSFVYHEGKISVPEILKEKGIFFLQQMQGQQRQEADKEVRLYAVFPSYKDEFDNSHTGKFTNRLSVIFV